MKIRVVLTVFVFVGTFVSRALSADTSNATSYQNHNVEAPQSQTGGAATLDANQIFQGYSKTKRLSDSIKEKADTFNQELQTLKQQGNTKQELDEYRKTHGKILIDDQSQGRESVVQDIQKAVNQYAHTQGFVVVYDKSGNFTPFFWSQQFGGGTITKPPKPSSPNGLDITDKIIDILNGVVTPPVTTTHVNADTLTNDSIIQLHKLGLGDSVVIEKIKASACQFDTSIDALKILKNAEISDAIIQAMLVASAPPPAASPH